MKLRALRRSRFAAVIFGLSLVLIPAIVHAATEPYLKTFGADVMSGGWFVNGGKCDTSPSGYYQDPKYSNNQSPLAGGIITYENYSKGGASSQYSAFALGEVESNRANNYGFYSANSFARGGNGNKMLTFANTSPGGGNYEGSIRQSNCIPDYYSKSSQTSLGSFSPDGSFPGSDGAYQYTPPSSTPAQLFGGSVNIAPGRKVTIFIKGNVWISDNITYSADTADNTTKFALVVLGNIFIAPNVTQMDGLYVAQPDPSDPSPVTDDTGNIWTCHDQNTTDPVDMPYVWKNCKNNLVINGSLVAKQVNFLRIPGDVNSASSGETTPTGAEATKNVAEIINFTPEMVVGGPFFNPSGSTFQIQSLTSLPPLF